MYFWIYGLAAAVLVAASMFFAKRNIIGTIVMSAISFVIIGWVGWLTMPVFAWNFYGIWNILLVTSCIALVGSLAFRDEDEPVWIVLPGLSLLGSLVMLLVVSFFTTSGMFHHERLRTLISEPIVSEFTADVSPVDINRIRRVDQELAAILGSRKIEEQPGLGSRVNLDTMNIQGLNGTFTILDGEGVEHKLTFDNEPVWVGPLVHADIFKWMSNHTTPGYVIVSALDPTKVYLVTGIRKENAVSLTGQAATESLNLKYLSNGAYFGDFAVRHLRERGYQSIGLTDYTFEIDNTGRPYYVITKYENTVGFGGSVVTGVVVLDVQTGAIQEYTVDNAPSWIDRIQPEDFVVTHVNDWGAYINGFWNSIFGQADVVKTTPGMSLVYGADGNTYYYSGMQSAGSDTGTNSFILVNSKTKEVRRYMISGGNETAACEAAKSAKGVAEAGYTCSNPILYNVSSEPTYFVPLKGQDGLVKMYAFVSVRTQDTIGVGVSVQEAHRNYQNALIRQGQTVTLDDLATQTRIDGVIADVRQIDNTFYLLIEGKGDVEFYGTSDVGPELKWARPGMNAVVLVQQGESKSQPIIGFDLPELTLTTLP